MANDLPPPVTVADIYLADIAARLERIEARLDSIVTRSWVYVPPQPSAPDSAEERKEQILAPARQQARRKQEPGGAPLPQGTKVIKQ